MKIKPTKSRNRVTVELGRTDPSLLAHAGGAENFTLRRILVPLDFSKCSRHAVRYAVAFARQFDASVTLLNVVPPFYQPGDFSGGIDYTAIEKDFEAGAQRELEAVGRRLIGRSVTWQPQLRFGRPAEPIAKVASELNVDLIILSTRGHTGIKHVVFGSTAENVVRHAPCPVLTLRAGEH